MLGVSLGESAVYSILRIIERLTRVDQPLSGQTTQMNTAVTPDRPWLDVAYQLANIAFPVVPALLVWYLLAVNAGPQVAPGRTPGARIGFDLRRPGFDLSWGFALAAGIGIPGLAFYLAAKAMGINTTVSAANLTDAWWSIPIYILSAAANGIVEEVVIVGYLFTRLRQVGWRWGWILVVSALIRGSYHLYQGFGGFLGNVVMGLAFGALWLRWKRVGPLVVAHTVLDIVAFVGYALLAGKVGWL